MIPAASKSALNSDSKVSAKMSLNRPSYAFRMVFFVDRYSGSLRLIA